MNDLDPFRRTTVAASLMAAPVLVLVSTVLQPPFIQGYADRLAALDEAGAAAWLSNAAFTLQQVFLLVAFLGVAHLLRHRSPRLSHVGSALGVLATFGEAVMGGVAMVWLTMAGDPTQRAVFAGVWSRLEASPVMLFGLVGFLGTVLTFLVLSIGLFRSRVVPRWVPALLGAFLVLEYGASGLSAFASYAGGICLLIAFGALAGHVWSGPRADRDGRAAPADIMAA